MVRASAVAVAVSLSVACGAKASSSPPLITPVQPSAAQLALRDELLKSLFTALAAGDTASMTKLVEPPEQVTASLVCSRPFTPNTTEERERFESLIRKVNGVDVSLQEVTDDHVLAAIPAGYDDGFGCITKVAITFHRLVLKLRVSDATGAVRSGAWTIQVGQRNGAWFLTGDVMRLDLGT